MPTLEVPYGIAESLATRGAVNVTSFARTEAQRSAMGNGASKPLSGFYSSLAAAQADYPHATALTDELDWAVLQGAINYLSTTDNTRGLVYVSRGLYLLNRTVTRPRWVSLVGDGPMATEFRATGPAFGPCFNFIYTASNPTGKGEVDIVDSMYYVNGNAVLTNVWEFNANNTITLQHVRAIEFTGIGVQIGSWSCRVEKALLACRQNVAGTICVQLNSDGVTPAGANGVVLDQVTAVYGKLAGVRITGDVTQSNGILLTGCNLEQNDVGLLIDQGAASAADIAVIGCRFEDNFIRSIKTDDQEASALTVLASFFSGQPEYHIEIDSKDAKIAFNHFSGHTKAAVKLVFDARRTFVGFNSSAPGFTLPIVEDGNPSRLLTQIDSFNSGLVSVKRYSAHEATPLTAADFSLPAAWGTGATVSNINANDSRGRFVVNAGTDGFAANPTVTITFADGPWPAAPFLRLARNGGAQPDVRLEYTTTTTAATITFRGTPASGESYTIEYFAVS